MIDVLLHLSHTILHNTQAGDAVICATTCLLPYGPQAYHIPLLRYMTGLGIFPRLKLTGYLLSQCANASRVHPDIVLSTTLEEEKKWNNVKNKGTEWKREGGVVQSQSGGIHMGQSFHARLIKR